MQLGARGENTAQFGECALSEGLFAEIVTGEGMSSHHRPIDVVGDALEESGAITVFESFKDLEDIFVR